MHKNHLRQIYLRMLEEHGLHQLEIPEQKIAEARAAMTDAGWPQSLQYSSTMPFSATHLYAPMLEEIAAEVENCIRERGASLPCTVYVGGFPLAEASGICMPLSEGTLILINHGLLQLLYQVGKILFHSYDWLCSGINSDGTIAVFDAAMIGNALPTMAATLGWSSGGWTRKRTIEALAEVLRVDRPPSSVTATPRLQLPTGSRALSLATVVHYAELFVVAHEYAHVLRQHHDLKSIPGPHRLQYERSRQQELESDELAASLLLARHGDTGDFDVNARIAGICLLFACSMFQGGLAQLALDPRKRDTHPTASARALRVLQWCDGHYGRSVTQFGRITMGWAFDLFRDVIGLDTT